MGTAAVIPLASIPVAGKGNKNKQHRIRCRIVRPDSNPAATDRIIIEPVPTGNNQVDTTNGGSFVTQIDPDDKEQDPALDEGEYRVGYYRIPPNQTTTGIVRDGNPDIANLSIVDASKGIGNLGTVHLTQAHVLDVKVVDEHDDPVEGVQVRVGHGGYGTDGATNQDGLLQFDSASVTGIELPDTEESDHQVRVSVGPAIGPPDPPQSFDLTADRILVFNENGDLQS